MGTNELEPEDLHNCPTSKSNEITRSCIDCHTTKTPCWRSGPAGPRTLCNACGIRYRKESSRALVSLDRARPDKSKRKIGKTSSSSKMGFSLKLRLMGYGREAGLQQEWQRKLGEEEQAAMLLMALSAGSVYS
uniref:Uncharacterized protein MANES_01G224400 n=1 Tax=Rhizophora mucronata TaxID=61149 RepID=A0A2P2KDA6_RHIMU